MGRVLGGICLAGVLLSASVLPHSFLSASKIFSDGRNKDISLLQSVLACLRPVIVALIFGAGLSILSMVVFGGNAKAFRNVDWIGVSSFAVAFFALRKLRRNPILTMCLCGVAGLGLHVLFGV